MPPTSNSNIEKASLVVFHDGAFELDVAVSSTDNTVWLTLDQISLLFEKDKSTVSRHIKNIFSDGELEKEAVVANYATTASDGKTYQVAYYNLDVIISVGYRVKSKRGIAFRKWATTVLNDYLLRGYAENKRRLEAQGKTIELQSRMIAHMAEVDEEELMSVINRYTEALDLLDDYEDVNHIRSLGDVFITEPKNAKKLMVKAKETSVNEKTGRMNRKRRFGKSIRNRCPGYFQSHAEDVFLSTGGKYLEVPYDYRASQYDHTNGEYAKRKLSQRLFPLSDGTVVQRDLYSSFLLYCASTDEDGQLILDGMDCINSFTSINRMHEGEIERIRLSGKKVLNSGIRV